MQLFIDSADPKEIMQARELGILDGVTTNPLLIPKGGPDMEATLKGVVEASPGPVLCQAIGWDDVESMKGQARWLHKFSEKIVVKLPMSQGGLVACQQLKKETPFIKIAITVICSIAQAYLAAKSGADIAALFNGALDQVIDQEVDMVAPVKQMYQNYGFATKILSCGRLPRAFGQFAVAGTDICTLKLEFIKLLYEHPYTDKRMVGFNECWCGTFAEKTWPKG